METKLENTGLGMRHLWAVVPAFLHAGPRWHWRPHGLLRLLLRTQGGGLHCWLQVKAQSHRGLQIVRGVQRRERKERKEREQWGKGYRQGQGHRIPNDMGFFTGRGEQWEPPEMEMV